MADILPYSMASAEEVGERLRRGEVGIFPCDTIYGLCGRADERIAERLYEIKRRPASKSFITLMDKSQLIDSSLPDGLRLSLRFSREKMVSRAQYDAHQIRIFSACFRSPGRFILHL